MSAPSQQTTSERPLAWLRQIPGDLFQLDEKPLLGHPPPFNWNEFEKQLKQIFQLEKISFTAGEWQWRAQNDLFSGISNNLRGFPLTLVPLSGTIWWAMPEADMAYLMGYVLSKRDGMTPESIDHDFAKGFYRFLAFEVISAFEKVNTDKKLTLKLAREEGLPTEACLCQDISINIQNKALHCRLFLSAEFRRSLAQNYQQPTTSMLSMPLADSLDVVINLEAGHVNIKPSEWKQIHPGDFLLLDKCLLDPDEEKGRVHLTINGVPYFRAKLKQGSLKILEHPLHYEVDTLMDQPTDENHDLDEDFEIEDEKEQKTPTAEEDFEIEDEEPSKPAAVAPKAAAGPKKEEKPGSPEVHVAAEMSPEPTASLEDVPLPIIVEVGRLQMSIKKLLELQPGNMLDLNVHPEAGVDLVVHGKRIARAELLRIGDSLGVRILEIS